MTQTAVEWLFDQLPEYLRLSKDGFQMLQQAKAMEEQQNEDFYKKGWFDAVETYGGKK
jgi:hypothetical protein